MHTQIKTLEEKFSKIANGYKEMETLAKVGFGSNIKAEVVGSAKSAYQSDVYQVRMYAVFLFGYLAADDKSILKFLKEKVSRDDNWRVQEILAKAFDEYCKNIGYENSLATIDNWLQSDNPNTRRAVTEDLRIWTSRDYFKTNPDEAIKRLAVLKNDSSEYVRKSIGNALRDISKKFPDLIKAELVTWKLDSKEIRQVHKLANKFIGRDQSLGVRGVT
ncbi:phosphomethylpyrimidine kinase [Treponema phagedenis]|uniref:DNA alkylation repair protein n=1 Tax=Treponema phagedenis TaxID=162 RepID=A0AAE6ITH6_TREPH|nr:DNA alkylation repair protein [Treponema phagedenis]EFW37421.1 HEAT repeat protein [Treponema phagedenis F0421]NVP23211.1 DNA alkylation repair protein [Treponema phagedenis]QEJ97985.1 DNA alkylation repair protein [Treponema phagedenis]QEK03492.1 DNA alkylation repair protein [Treponema phagedenis]QEK09119.1 DNA alkylation repair protein [Treponema phagedenis]